SIVAPENPPSSTAAGRHTQPSRRWLLMNASQALRCACSELNSCSSPSSEDLRVQIAQRTLASRTPRPADGVIAGLGADHGTGSPGRAPNRGPDQCAPVVRWVITVSER